MSVSIWFSMTSCPMTPVPPFSIHVQRGPCVHQRILHDRSVLTSRCIVQMDGRHDASGSECSGQLRSAPTTLSSLEYADFAGGLVLSDHNSCVTCGFAVRSWPRFLRCIQTTAECHSANTVFRHVAVDQQLATDFTTGEVRRYGCYSTGCPEPPVLDKSQAPSGDV